MSTTDASDRWTCPTCNRTFPTFVSKDHVGKCDGNETALPDNVTKAFEQLNEIAADRSAAGRALGRIKTARKTASSQATIPLATAASAAVRAKPCTCGRTDGSHATACGAYHRTKMAGYRARKKEKEGLAENVG